MSQGNKIILAILLGSGVIAGGIYFGLGNISRHPGGTVPQPTASVSPAQVTATPTPTPTPTPTQAPPTTPAEITWTKSDLIAALSQKTGIPANEIKFSVGKQIKKPGKVLLNGSVSRQGEMGGAGFFAIVNASGVKVTYAGQGVPQCSEVNPYGYPLSWADYCVNSQGQTVKR